ncbi:uncharacterized protein Dmoj_GI16085 [Drosophila mojavensis]|uniref:Uncharacterized protein n=2 Tax=Drosophila mojavensis TaxID=7230 RepID=B4L6X8_DROMO|nr:uncharacterized protein Dmoj_GI16085 [Drosophila mojavensis]
MQLRTFQMLLQSHRMLRLRTAARNNYSQVQAITSSWLQDKGSDGDSDSDIENRNDVSGQEGVAVAVGVGECKSIQLRLYASTWLICITTASQLWLARLLQRPGRPVDKMERWRNKVAVVSGASAGIGAACARALVGAGLLVVGLARRQERIEEMRAKLPPAEQRRLHARRCDITRESEVLAAFDWAQRELGGVHVLVNNAGIIATTELSGPGNTQAIRDTIETNLMGSVYCIREAFQAMRRQEQQQPEQARGEGHVIIVNSVAGQQVPNLGPQLPSLNIYPATKFALRAMQEIYRQEFQRHQTRVRVSTISPGIVDTDILPEQIQGVIKPHMPMLRSEDVADAVLWTISTPANVQVQNITIKPQGEKF